MACIFWIVVLAVVIACVVLLWKERSSSDDSSMSVGRRRFLVLYLLVVGGFLVYFLVRVYSVQFPDNVVQVGAAPTFSSTEQPSDAKQPILKQISPRSIPANTPLPNLELYGYNFTQQSKVRVNATERNSVFVSSNILIVPMGVADVANSSRSYIDVLNGDRGSNTLLFEVTSPGVVTGELQVGRLTAQITPETRLILIVLLAGALGSYIHAIKSLADFLGNRTLIASWFWWYITRPFLGMTLALVFYAALRGGFLVGTPADVKFVNPFGAFTVAALVGMFADKATQKLGELFDTLFRTEEKRSDKLHALVLSTDSLPEGSTTANYEYAVQASGGVAPYSWTVVGLPTGLTVDAKSGLITGRATQAGQSDVQVSVTDAEDQSAHGSFNLVIK